MAIESTIRGGGGGMMVGEAVREWLSSVQCIVEDGRGNGSAVCGLGGWSSW